MERKLIKIEDDYVLVGSFTTPEEGMLFITRDNVLHTNIGWNYGDRLVIASTNAHHNVNKLSLKNCQAIERGYDLDDLAIDYIGEPDKKHWIPSEYNEFVAFKEGFQKALELMGDKKFSENDVLKVVTHVFNELVLVDGFNKNYLFPESIYQETTTKCKSMQQKEWDVILDDENLVGSDGCYILRKK